tara:strand:- start:91 stop:255 length:165 start_codon:yes stop_codon:yes gene_type:complete
VENSKPEETREALCLKIEALERTIICLQSELKEANIINKHNDFMINKLLYHYAV